MGRGGRTMSIIYNSLEYLFISNFSRLTLLPIILRLLALAAYLPDDGVQYIKDAEEAELCLKTMNYGVFIDLLVSILTRRQKVHKAIVYYAFYLIHDNLKRSHLKQILKVKIVLCFNG